MKRAKRKYGRSGWRMFHYPSGMFYCPSRTIKWQGEIKSYRNFSVPSYEVKSNFSETGKLYFHCPSIGYIGNPGNILFTHIPMDGMDFQSMGSFYNNRIQPFIEVNYSEWDIIEYTNGEEVGRLMRNK